MAKFAVGDKCILVNLTVSTRYNNQVVIVDALPREIDWDHPGPGYGTGTSIFVPSGSYVISAEDGFAHVQEKNLRKLPPGGKDTTEDPGLTLIKKLLEQDTKKEKEHA